MLLKLVKQLTNISICNFIFGPRVNTGPRPFPLVLMGPRSSNQRPGRRNGLRPRPPGPNLACKSSPTASRPSPRIKDLTAVRTLHWNKTPAASSPLTLALSFLLPFAPFRSSHRQRQVERHGRRPASIGEERRRLA
jgi:hypothetical protein